MFKLKPGNVFEKLNKMDKKQAYTWGAIVVVCFIALITLASFLGDADDASFDGYNTRGYDLAQMPFVNDEAEEYLLASKYPDMKNNGSSMLYTQAEKEARQEADAQAQEGEDEGSSSQATVSTSANVYSGRGYAGGRGGSGGAGAPTQVGQLGSASMSHAGGSGVGATYGAPRGDFSAYKSQEKGSEIQAQLKNTDAKKALSQFAQTSRAAAGLRDGKGGNAKRALMGGNIKGSDAFTETGVDLSKAGGLALDTNAPSSSTDLSNLDQKVGDGAQKAKDEKKADEDKFKQSLSDRLLEQFLTGLLDMGLNAMSNFLNQGIDSLMGNYSAGKAGTQVAKQDASAVLGKNIQDLNEEERKMLAIACNVKPEDLANKTGSARDFFRESNGKPSLSAPPSRTDNKYKLDSVPAGGRLGEDYTMQMQMGPAKRQTVKIGEGEFSYDAPDLDSAKLVVYDAKQYNKDLKQYNQGYNANMNDDINDFAKATKASYYPNSNSSYAQNYQAQKTAAYNSRQRNDNSKRSDSNSNSNSTAMSQDLLDIHYKYRSGQSLSSAEQRRWVDAGQDPAAIGYQQPKS